MSHNTRSSSLGKPEALPLSTADVARFWAKVNRVDGGCWLWLSNRTGSLGYGQFGYQVAKGRQRSAYAHRIAWTLSHGTVPDGLFVLHRCDNPICVNPAHLYVGNHKKNMEDAQARGRLHAPRPNKQRLTDAQCDEMVDLVRGGALQGHVAALYGCSKALVSLLVKGQRRQYRPSLKRQEAA